MNKLTGFIGACMLLFVSCKKENNTTAVSNNTLPPPAVILARGNFISGAHPVSGTVKVLRDTSEKVFLVFENFVTDNGPDLRVWISPNIAANPYQEIGSLKAVTGNFSYELDASVNYTVNNRVLIWCRPFSVLYGYAVLQ